MVVQRIARAGGSPKSNRIGRHYSYCRLNARILPLGRPQTLDFLSQFCILPDQKLAWYRKVRSLQ